jgi:hypothetical protein
MTTFDSGWCDQAEQVHYSFSQTLYISSMKVQVHVLLEDSRYSKVNHILAETSFDVTQQYLHSIEPEEPARSAELEGP